MVKSNKLLKVVLTMALIATFANAKQKPTLAEYKEACSNNIANACYLAGYIYHEANRQKEI